MIYTVKPGEVNFCNIS